MLIADHPCLLLCLKSSATRRLPRPGAQPVRSLQLMRASIAESRVQEQRSLQVEPTNRRGEDAEREADEPSWQDVEPVRRRDAETLSMQTRFSILHRAAKRTGRKHDSRERSGSRNDARGAHICGSQSVAPKIAENHAGTAGASVRPALRTPMMRKRGP